MVKFHTPDSLMQLHFGYDIHNVGLGDRLCLYRTKHADGGIQLGQVRQPGGNCDRYRCHEQQTRNPFHYAFFLL